MDANKAKAIRKILVTSALVYANGPLHIGHLVEYIQTDIFVRFLRLTGENVIYICADDTHGAPIQINAEKLGMVPEQLIDKFYKEHTRDFAAFNISFDNYYTTHSDENKFYSDKMFKIAKEKGFIFKKKVNQFFCESCNRFLPDRFIKGVCPKCKAEDQYGDVCEKCGSTHKPTELISPRCATCSKTPVEKESDHCFFKLSAFSDKLLNWLDNNPNLQPEILNSVKQWITEGLTDWDISRDGPYFGFKIPEEDNLYYYVWWDAPIGYIASTDNYLKREGKIIAEQYWRKNLLTDIYHFIGKDIIYFHYLFWPAVLMSSRYQLPKAIPVHGFLTVNGEKMSKSRGTFLTAEEFLKDHNPENLRYYFASSLGRKLADIDLNFDEFTARINNELVANIGNFCYRTFSFTEKNFESGINFKNNKLLKKINNQESVLFDTIQKKFELIRQNYTNLNFKEAIKEILEVGDLGNKFFQDNAPWKLKNEDQAKCEAVLAVCINIAKNLSILLKPIIPIFSENLQKQIGLSDLTWNDLGFEVFSDEPQFEEYKIQNSGILVEKLDTKKGVDLDSKKLNQFPLNLKVAQIEDIKEHPSADKLYIIKVSLGDEKRQIVAGLRPYIEQKLLLGKKIILLTNLKTAKLRGELSEGMLLAANNFNSENGCVKVLSPKNSKPGDQVYPEGQNQNEISNRKISFDEFVKLNKFSVKDGLVYYDGKLLKTDLEKISIDMPDEATIR